jgi:hypothetical protein
VDPNPNPNPKKMSSDPQHWFILYVHTVNKTSII